MNAHAQQPPDPRKPAWDAVFAYIRTLPREQLPASVVERNAMIWRAVNAALAAIGYPDADQRQAAPAQPEQPLRQRIAANPPHCRPGCDFCDTDEMVDAVLAAVQPDLDALRAENQRLRDELAAVDDELTAQHQHNDATCSAVAERDQLRQQLAALGQYRLVSILTGNGAVGVRCNQCNALLAPGPITHREETVARLVDYLDSQQHTCPTIS